MLSTVASMGDCSGLLKVCRVNKTGCYAQTSVSRKQQLHTSTHCFVQEIIQTPTSTVFTELC